MPDGLQTVLDAVHTECARIEEDCTYSSKSHFNASDTWLLRHYLIGIPATLLGIIAGAAIIKAAPGIAAICSLISTILAALVTFLKPSERASIHKSIGDQYLALKNDARLFREIELLVITKPNIALDGTKSLVKRRNALNQGSPTIPKKAFQKARSGIEQGEANYIIDKKELG